MDNSSVASLVIGCTVVANFVLTLAAIRKLRELEERPGAAAADFGLPAPGTPLGEFTVEDADGITLSSRAISTGTVRMAFLLPGCKPCEQLKAALRVMPPSDVPLIAVVSADGKASEVAAIAADLPAYARIVAGSLQAQVIGAAAEVSTYPAMLTLVDGVIVHASAQAIPAGRQITQVA